MNDLSGFEVLENVQSPFEDDPFEEMEETGADAPAQEGPEETAPAQKDPAQTAPAKPPKEPTPQPCEKPEEEKRVEHEAAEARRKAEWEAKRAEKCAARQAALDRIKAMNDQELIEAATQKAGRDTEKLTRRNMKECVCEYIQTLCMEDTEFARLTMQPQKSMIHCFAYISRKAQLLMIIGFFTICS